MYLRILLQILLDMKKLYNSEQLYKRAITFMPGGVSSPVRAGKNILDFPIYIVRGEGPYIYDADGNKYIDMCCCWGANIAGHAHPWIIQSVSDTLKNGLHFGACHPLEIEVAEYIIKANGRIDMVRFVNSGTEATMSAIRLARAYTGRTLIVKFEGCYHGHSDYFLVKAGSGVAHIPESTSPGIPSESISTTIVLPFNDEGALERVFTEHGEKIACVIVEGIPANYGIIPPTSSFYKKISELTEKYGALLVIDEVITGFRIGMGGATHLYNLNPDIVCFGKIIGGGMPVGAYGGRKDIMENVAPAGNVYQAGTLSGNPLALAAGKAQLGIIQQDNTFYFTLQNRTSILAEEIKDIFCKKGIPATVIWFTGMLWIGFGIESPPCSADDLKRMDIDAYKTFYRAVVLNCTDDPLVPPLYLPPSPYEVLFLTIAHDDSVIEQIVTRFKRGAESFLNKSRV